MKHRDVIAFVQRHGTGRSECGWKVQDEHLPWLLIFWVTKETIPVSQLQDSSTLCVNEIVKLLQFFPWCIILGDFTCEVSMVGMVWRGRDGFNKVTLESPKDEKRYRLLSVKSNQIWYLYSCTKLRATYTFALNFIFCSSGWEENRQFKRWIAQLFWVSQVFHLYVTPEYRFVLMLHEIKLNGFISQNF